MNKVKIVLVDDHTIFLNGLEAILKRYEFSKDIILFDQSIEALNHIENNEVDIVITDISMPQINGIDLLAKVKKSKPSVKVIVLSMHTENAIVKNVLKNAPDAYLLKNSEEKDFFSALDAVQKGEKYYCNSIKNILLDSATGNKKTSNSSIIPILSKREKQVLELIAKEFTTQEIADKLFLSVNTIETYRQNLLLKLGAKNSPGIIAKAYQYGILN
ncbi:Two component transcriptional regulator, LuxR family [Flavobacterium sp. 9AF]|uniref:response regulator transcription factor n=1 Tax=Flavobacterium sp. 9AF TaxID=2653142 RepID=UPI0012F3633C|nr:response regulator transcription factor [Flavobacterium sp. 9AF]VXB01239.1 Two component transcriptional regulator, LuxR family [Flavobacterium sp. 9AF]